MTTTRASNYADAYVTAHSQFKDLVGSLSDAQWALVGSNFPDRINDEDEARSIGVIAHHVADAEQFIIDRIHAMLEGRPLSRLDIHEVNARHADLYAAVTRDEVMAVLRVNEQQIAARIRAIPDEALDAVHETPAGPATIAQRLDRVLIGHMKMHQGSIERALAG